MQMHDKRVNEAAFYHTDEDMKPKLKVMPRKATTQVLDSATPLRAELAIAHQKLRDGYLLVMEAVGLLGYPVETDPNFDGTSLRAAKAMGEMIQPRWEIETQVDKYLKATFPSSHDELIVSPSIPAYGLCPHHLLPVLYDVIVAYVPGCENRKSKNKSYSILGLSKIPRIVQLAAKQPLCQETLTQELADIFYTKLHSAGSAVYTWGRHTCMECRGVELAGGTTTVSAVRGDIRKYSKLREETLRAIQAERSNK